MKKQIIDTTTLLDWPLVPYNLMQIHKKLKQHAPDYLIIFLNSRREKNILCFLSRIIWNSAYNFIFIGEELIVTTRYLAL
jgi:hypothetical protein